MKSQNAANRTFVIALPIVFAIVLAAMFSHYPGFIELKCSTQGCGVVIDARSQGFEARPGRRPPSLEL